MNENLKTQYPKFYKSLDSIEVSTEYRCVQRGVLLRTVPFVYHAGEVQTVPSHSFSYRFDISFNVIGTVTSQSMKYFRLGHTVAKSMNL